MHGENVALIVAVNLVYHIYSNQIVIESNAHPNFKRFEI